MKSQSITLILAGILFSLASNTSRALDMVVSNTTVTDAITLVSGTNTFTTDAGLTGTITGVVSGPADAALVKLGGGALSLTAAPTYTGPTQVLGGTLRLASTSAYIISTPGSIIAGPGSTLWTSKNLTVGNSTVASLQMSNGGILDMSTGGNLYIGGNAGGNGTLIATDQGTQILLAGPLYIANNAATGTLAILNGASMSVGGLLDIARQVGGVATVIVSGTNSKLDVSGVTSMSPNGSSVLSITDGASVIMHANFNPVGTLATSTAAIIVDGRTSLLSITGNVGSGNGFPTYTISNGGQFRVNGNFTTTLRAVVTLSNGGLVSSTNAINMNGKLAGSGTFMSTAGSATFAPSAVLAPGVVDAGGIGELYIGGTLTLNGATLQVDTAAGGLSDRLAVNGDLLFTATRSTIDVSTFNSGTFNIITTTGTIGDTTGVLDVNSIKVGGAAPTARQGVDISVVNNNTVQLLLSATNLAIAWANTGGNIWRSSDAGNANWSNPAGPGMTYFMNGDAVTFDAAHSGSVGIVGTVTVSGMDVAGDYRFGGGSIMGDTAAATGLAATGRLTKTGAGTLYFENGANDFRGGIDIGGGLVVFTNGNQLGTTGTTLSFSNSGTLRAGAAALSLGNNMQIAAGAAATIDTNTYNLAHTGTLSSASSGTLVKTGAGALTLAGDSSANGGSVLISAGTLALAANAKLKGNAAIASGRLLVAGGAALIGNATANNSAASIAGTGTITGNVTLAGGALLEIGGDGAAAPGVLNIAGSLSVANSILSFNFAGGTNSLLHVGGGGVVATGANIINVGAASLATGTYTLGNIGDIMNSATVSVLIDNSAQSTASRTKAAVFRDATTPANLLLSYGMDVSRRMTWAPPGNGNWNASLQNWAGDGQTVFQNGDMVVFFTGAANTSVTIDTAVPRVSDMLVDNTGTLAFAGLGIQASATTAMGSVLAAPSGRLVKTGPGALVFNNGANYFEGGIDIGNGAAGSTGGLLVFNNAGQLGVSKTASITFNNTGTLMPGAGFDPAGALAATINIKDGVTGVINTAGQVVSYSGTLRASSASAVLQKSGAGALQLLGDSGDYAGSINVDAGALMLAGGTVGGAIQVRAGAAFGGWGSATGAGGVHVWSGGGVLLTNTTNALNISNLVFEQNSSLAGQGTLAGSGTIKDGVTVTGSVGAGGAITLAGVLSGPGATIEKTGDGDLAVGAASSVYIGAVNINQGALVLSGSSQMRAKTAMNINEGGALRAPGNAALNLDPAAVLTNNGVIEVGRAAGAKYPYSTLVINGGHYAGGYGATAAGGKISLYVSNTLVSGTMVLADKLVFGPDTTVSGTTWIDIKRDAVPALFSRSEMPPLVEVQGRATPDAFFKSDAIGQAGSAYDMWYEWTASGAGQWKQDLAAEIPAVTGLDTSAILIGKASVDALGQRLRSTHYDVSPRQFGLWVSGLYRHDQLRTSRYNESKSNARGIQAGADWTRSKDNNDNTSLVGIYYDYTTAGMNQPGRVSSTDTDSHGFGAYGSMRIGSWYADAMARYSRENHTVSVSGRDNFATKGNGYMLAVQTGAVLGDFRGYKIDPNIRLARQWHKLNNATDSFGRVYEITGAESFEARAGVSLWDEFTMKNGLKIWPRIGASVTYEFKGSSTVLVEGRRFENNLQGIGTLVDLGLNMQLSRRVTLDLGASWQYSDSLKDLYCNAGISCRW